MKKLLVDEVPCAFVIETGPEVAPFGIIAEIWDSELTVKDEALTPLILTAVVPMKFDPLMVMLPPILPEVGVKFEMDGRFVTVKFMLEIPEPAGMKTRTGPLPTAPAGTATVMEVAVELIGVADTLLKKRTEVAPVKLNPVIVTVVPIGPLTGLMPVMVGVGEKTGPVPVPAVLVTETAPSVTLEGTVALISVLPLTVNIPADTPLNFTAETLVKLLPEIVI